MQQAEFISRIDAALIETPVWQEFPEADFRQWLTYYLRMSGKRIRPSLLWAVYTQLGGTDWERLVKIGTAVELTHNWTIIEDDWMDRDDERRGQPALHRLIADNAAGVAAVDLSEHYGRTMATLVADTLQSTASRMVMLATAGLSDNQRSEIGQYFEAAVIQVARGQLLDMQLQDRLLSGAVVSEAQTIEMLICKTASLCRLVFWLGAKLAGDANPVMWAQLGQEFGLIFQLRNDINDCKPTSDARQPYSDLLEMKPTIINIRLWQRLDETVRQQWLEAVRHKSAEMAAPIIEQLRQTNLVADCEQELQQLADKLTEKLIALPTGAGRDAIAEWLGKIRQ